MTTIDESATPYSDFIRDRLTPGSTNYTKPYGPSNATALFTGAVTTAPFSALSSSLDGLKNSGQYVPAGAQSLVKNTGVAVSIGIGLVDVADALDRRDLQGVIVETSGIAGSLAGAAIGVEGGATLGALVTPYAGPYAGGIVGGISSFVLGVYGAYQGEDRAQEVVYNLTTDRRSETQKLRDEKAVRDMENARIDENIRSMISNGMDYSPDAVVAAHAGRFNSDPEPARLRIQPGVTQGETRVVQTPSGPKVVSVMTTVDTPSGPKEVWVGSHGSSSSNSAGGVSGSGGEGAANNGHAGSGSSSGSGSGGQSFPTGGGGTKPTYVSGTGYVGDHPGPSGGGGGSGGGGLRKQGLRCVWFAYGKGRYVLRLRER